VLADYHTHTPLCRHAGGRPLEYAAAAKAAGLAEIGFADHNPMPETFDDWRMDIAELPEYLDMVAEARAAHPDLPVRLGLECDYLPDARDWLEKTATLAPWDYLIGSVHYISGDWAVDNPAHLSRWSDPSRVGEIWEMYWARYEECVRSGLFDFCAHPDLVKKFGHRPDGDPRRFYEPVVQAFVDTGTVMEVSTAGLRKDCRELYPAKELIELACRAGVPIVISSDAHQPGEVGAGFDLALAAVREAGYRHSSFFHQRRRRQVELPSAWPSPAGTPS
jgi:histidinol-phosphatase (PHP family)